MTPYRHDVLGVGFDVLTMKEARQTVQRVLQGDGCVADHSSHPLQIATVNPEIVMLARATPRLTDVLHRCGLVVADGIGVIWASHRLGRPLPERIAGIELAYGILEDAAAARIPVFFLGGDKGVAEEAAARLQQRLPQLNVAGTHHGYFSSEEENRIVEGIAASGAKIVLAGLGAPKQELWLARHGAATGAHVLIGVGGSLDHFAGRVRRAPKIWQRLHVEWLYRLLTQPTRWRRIGALPRFVAMVYREKYGRDGP